MVSSSNIFTEKTKNKKKSKIFIQETLLSQIKVKKTDTMEPKTFFWLHSFTNPSNFKNLLLYLPKLNTNRFIPRLCTLLAEYRQFKEKEIAKSIFLLCYRKKRKKIICPLNTSDEKKKKRIQTYKNLKQNYPFCLNLNFFESKDFFNILHPKLLIYKKNHTTKTNKPLNFYNNYKNLIHLFISFHNYKDNSIFNKRASWWLCSYGLTKFFFFFFAWITFLKLHKFVWNNCFLSLDIIFKNAVIWLKDASDPVCNISFFIIIAFLQLFFETKSWILFLSFFFLIFCTLVLFFKVTILIARFVNFFINFLCKLIYEPEYILIVICNIKHKWDFLTKNTAKFFFYIPGIKLYLNFLRLLKFFYSWFKINFIEPILYLIFFLKSIDKIKHFLALYSKMWDLFWNIVYGPSIFSKILLGIIVEIAFICVSLKKGFYMLIKLVCDFLQNVLFVFSEIGTFMLFRESLFFDACFNLGNLWKIFIKSLYSLFPKIIRRFLKRLYLENKILFNMLTFPFFFWLGALLIKTNLWIFPTCFFLLEFIILWFYNKIRE